MIKLKDILERMFKESSLSRVWQLVEEDKYNFAIISAQRGEYREKGDINEKRHMQLKKDVRALGYGFIEMRGGFVEAGFGQVYEDSLLVPLITKQEAVTLGTKYSQDAILYKDDAGFDEVSSSPTNPGNVLKSFKKGAGKDNLDLAKEAVKHYFSALAKGSHKGKKFLFKTVEERQVENWIMKMHEVQDDYKRPYKVILEII